MGQLSWSFECGFDLACSGVGGVYHLWSLMSPYLFSAIRIFDHGSLWSGSLVQTDSSGCSSSLVDGNNEPLLKGNYLALLSQKLGFSVSSCSSVLPFFSSSRSKASLVLTPAWMFRTRFARSLMCSSPLSALRVSNATSKLNK
jgi:hypothetical protein